MQVGDLVCMQMDDGEESYGVIVKIRPMIARDGGSPWANGIELKLKAPIMRYDVLWAGIGVATLPEWILNLVHSCDTAECK